MKLSSFVSQSSGGPKQNKGRLRKAKPIPFDVREFLKKHQIDFVEESTDFGTRFDVTCPFCNNPGANLLWGNDKTGGYKCFHNSCKEKHLADYVKHYDPSLYESDKKEALKPSDLTDAGNAASFLDHNYGSNLLWSESLGWLNWNGQYWERNDQGALAAALNYSSDLLEEARTIQEKAAEQMSLVEAQTNASQEDLIAAQKALDNANSYLAFALKTRSKTRLEAIPSLCIPSLKKPANIFDADPFLLCTPAGEINLKDGSVSPHKKESFCTKITAVGPSSDIHQHEIWQNFLSELTCGDKELENYLQYVAGMTLIGKVYWEGLIFGYGSGSNGKSTYFNCVNYALGDYGGTIQVRALMTQTNNNVGASLASLRSKRLIIASESEEGQRLSLSTIKQITSRDDITGEEKFKPPITFTPSHTLVLFTNFLPRVGSMDNGTWRRLVVCPFLADFTGKKDDKSFSEKLQQEAAGAALKWAIKGAGLFIKNNFELPDCNAVIEATSKFRNEEDWLKRFMDECTKWQPDGGTNTRKLYKAYREWADSTGESFIRSERDFSNEMSNRGYHSEHKTTGTVWMGIQLIQESYYPENSRYSSNY